MIKYFFLIVCVLTTAAADNLWAGEKILFSRPTDGYWQVWIMDPDGRNQKQITASPSDKREPDFLNDGSQITFRTSNSELFIADADGKNETQLLQEYGTITNPSFSPDGKSIIFVRFEARPGDISDIWKLDLETRKSTILTQDHQPKYQPRYSSDGKKIVFVKAGGGTKDYHIWMMDADGGNQKELTRSGAFDTHPEFSPEGIEVAFSSNRNAGVFDIYQLNVATGKELRLTEYDGLDAHSSYSPDGGRLVFVSDQSGSQQLWVMDKDGKGRRQVTFDSNEAADPRWVHIKEEQK